jgi:hypothetical protein
MLKKTILKIVSIAIVAGILVGAFAWLPTINAQAADLYGRGGFGGAGAAGSGTGATTGTPAYGVPANGTSTMGGDYRGYGSRGAYAGSGIVLGPLSDAKAEALTRAIQEEFGAQALYESVLDTFGSVIPFDTIAQAEAQHATALVNLANKYGVAVPEFPSGDPLPAFTTLAEACQAGVDAEIADAALYDELMALTTHSDLLRVYTNLQNASLNNHLPAFEACN